MATQCPKCNSENADTARFCSNCASPLQPSEEIHAPTQTIEAPREELTTGSTFAGRYQIIEELGKGGMGKVYRALDKKLNEEVALKLIKPEIASDRKTLERFQNELKLARKIRHSNIGGMYELLEDKGLHYITMEYVSGEDLKSFIRRSKQLSIPTVMSIAKQICDGLSEAHKLGVVHRDLKPSNIMIDKNGNVRIMDFGIARSLKGKGITDAGVMIGTPEYMSPEQVEGKDVDHRSDIYSLGVILYEMVTGSVPFEGDTPFTVGVKHKSEIPTDPKEFNNQIPHDLNNVILKCLEKEKENRYQSAGELHSEIINIEKGIPTTARAVAERRPITSREITVTFGLKKLFIPTLVVVSLMIAVVMVIWQPWSQKETLPITSDKASIAVLSFDDLSPQKDQEYLCNGFAESIINALTRVEELRIPAPTSSFLFKGKEIDLKEVGEKLNVKTVLRGSVQKAGNKIRITAQLINVADETFLWSEQYNRELNDVFAIQDAITLEIVDKLRIKLMGGEKANLGKHHTENLEAYNLYLMGRHFWNKRTEEGFRKAIECFKQAIELDPNYALSYAGLSDSYGIAASYGYLPTNEAYSKAKNAVTRALKLDDTLSEAHTSMAIINVMDWDWKGAEEAFQRAIKLNANYATAHHWYSYVLSNMGRHEEAIKEAKIAQEIDPLSPIMSRGLGGVYLFARQYEKAIEELNKTIEFDPESFFGHLWLSYAYLQSKMYRESIDVLKEFVSLIGFGDQRALIEQTYADSGFSAALRQVISIIPAPYIKATLFAFLGEKEQAFEWLEKADYELSINIDLKANPLFDGVRSDPRFIALLKKMNLE
ncbi:MAG: protein kinase [Candidatus Aminicenantaceae bacterium]